VLPEAACGEPDDVGVYRDLNDGVTGAFVLPAGAAAERAGQGLIPGVGGEVVQALPLARDPDAGAQGLVDGAGGGADSGLDFLPLVMVQLSEVVALRAAATAPEPASRRAAAALRAMHLEALAIACITVIGLAQWRGGRRDDQTNGRSDP